MGHGLNTSLRILEPEDLEHVRGSGGGLDIAFTAPPVRGHVGITASGPRGSVSGTLSTDGRAWTAGIQTSINPSPKVGLEGSFRTDGRNWEAGVAARIRFLRA